MTTRKEAGKSPSSEQRVRDAIQNAETHRQDYRFGPAGVGDCLTAFGGSQQRDSIRPNSGRKGTLAKLHPLHPSGQPWIHVVWYA